MAENTARLRVATPGQAAATVLIALGARVYRAGITRTGPRIRLREALLAPPRRPRPTA